MTKFLCLTEVVNALYYLRLISNGVNITLDKHVCTKRNCKGHDDADSCNRVGSLNCLGNDKSNCKPIPNLKEFYNFYVPAHHVSESKSNKKKLVVKKEASEPVSSDFTFQKQQNHGIQIKVNTQNQNQNGEHSENSINADIHINPENRIDPANPTDSDGMTESEEDNDQHGGPVSPDRYDDEFSDEPFSEASYQSFDFYKESSEYSTDDPDDDPEFIPEAGKTTSKIVSKSLIDSATKKKFHLRSKSSRIKPKVKSSELPECRYTGTMSLDNFFKTCYIAFGKKCLISQNLPEITKITKFRFISTLLNAIHFSKQHRFTHGECENCFLKIENYKNYKVIKKSKPNPTNYFTTFNSKEITENKTTKENILIKFKNKTLMLNKELLLKSRVKYFKVLFDVHWANSKDINKPLQKLANQYDFDTFQIYFELLYAEHYAKHDTERVHYSPFIFCPGDEDHGNNCCIWPCGAKQSGTLYTTHVYTTFYICVKPDSPLPPIIFFYQRGGFFNPPYSPQPPDFENPFPQAKPDVYQSCVF